MIYLGKGSDLEDLLLTTNGEDTWFLYAEGNETSPFSFECYDSVIQFVDAIRKYP